MADTERDQGVDADESSTGAASDGGGRFARATAVSSVGSPDDSDGSDAADGRHRYAARVHEGWDIGGNANGGYLLAIAGRAMASAVDRLPVTLTAHYLRPAPAGPCTVDVDVVRTGRRLATASATLSMDQGTVLALLGSFGDVDDGSPPAAGRPPDLPPHEECVERPRSAETPTLMSNLAVRIHPDDVGFALDRPTGRAEMRGWFDLADGEPLDPIALLLAVDSFPPPVFNTDRPVAWVPTVELTIHVRATRFEGPLACVFRSRRIGAGMTEEDGEVYDADGRLVALSRQLALLPRPPE